MYNCVCMCVYIYIYIYICERRRPPATYLQDEAAEEGVRGAADPPLVHAGPQLSLFIITSDLETNKPEPRSYLIIPC